MRPDALPLAFAVGLVLASASVARAQQPIVTPPIGAQPAVTPTLPPIRQPILVPLDTPVVSVTPVPRLSPTPVPALTGQPTAVPATGTPTPVPAATEIPIVLRGERTWTAPEPGQERNIELPGFTGPADTALGNPAAFAALSPLRKAWFVREYYRGRGDEVGAKKALSTLIDLKLDSGIANVTTISAALVKEARMLQKGGRKAEALEVATAAAALAPDFPPAQMALARARIGSRNGLGAVDAAQDAIAASLHNLRTRVRLVGNTSLALLGGLWAAFALFIAVALLRHGRFLLHDFKHALADKLPVWMAAIILVPFLAFPLVFGLGPLPLLAWLTLALWLKLSVKERVIAASFLVLGAATPTLAGLASGCFAFEAGDAGRLYGAIREDEMTPRELKELAEKAGATGDPDLLLTVANAHLRAGRYGEAKRFYELATEKGGAPALVGQGNVRYALSDPPGAVSFYEKALAAEPGRFSASYNLFRIRSESIDLNATTAAQDAAKKIDAKQVEAMNARGLPDNRKMVVEAGSGAPIVAAAYLNRRMVVDDVPDGHLLSRAWADAAARGVAAKTWQRASPALRLDAVGFLFMGALALVGLISVAFRGLIAARPCPRCGRGLCLRCDGVPLQEDLCVQCFHAFLHTEGIDPRQRALKEREVRNWGDTRRRRRALLSVLVPGGGHLLGGETVRGIILLLIASIAAIRLSAWQGWFLPAFPAGGIFTWVTIGTAGLLLVVAWIFGLRGHSDPPAMVRGTR